MARDPAARHLELGLYRNAGLSGDLLPSLTPVPGEPLRYPLNGIALAPFFEGTEDPTHACFRRAEPRVVFGGTDSGVADPARSDGTALLDDIWAGAPFTGKGALLARVRSAVDVWRSAGLARPGRRRPGGGDGTEGLVRAVSRVASR
ncbi:hypothetical protein ACH49_12595 [Streptomyces leeuwenhoekii]|uniref:Uncharacterized protein n=1 Tax=Streptomyces leeuwenhoekii TaxID=1437453 RepID=A0ABR5HZH3_STRLW|nr:hypothetical protein ACH49_12595 [Streptomyces leeuwenhoekii]